MNYINSEYGKIRIVTPREIEDAVAEIFVSANYALPSEVRERIEQCRSRETSEVARGVLCRLCDNIDAAKELDIPVCQDTGMAVLFAEIGQDVHIAGNFEDAVNRGVARAYREGFLRLSVISDPIYDRKNTNDNTPAIIHIKSVSGDKIKLTAAPKGFGSENMSAVKMLTPAAGENGVVDFVLSAVKAAGSNPCPPIVVGVGIGGDFEYCAEMAKRALTRPLDDENPDGRYAALEKKLLCEINKLGIGAQGFGGDTTALAVKVNFAPTHIAGLPCAVNINCHVVRHVEKEI